MTYLSRQRETLMDNNLRDALHRRSKELLGLVLLGAGTFAAIAFGSYSAQDSGLLRSTGDQAQNLFGSSGAEVTSIFVVTFGLATWCIPVFLWLWGLRFLSHFGSERFATRIIFLPLFVLLTSLVFSSFSTPSFWPHQFGAGGMLGDAVLGALVYSWPNRFGDGINIVPQLSILVWLVGMGSVHGITTKGAIRFFLAIAKFLRATIYLLTGAGFRSHPVGADTDSQNGRGWRRFIPGQKAEDSEFDLAEEYDSEFVEEQQSQSLLNHLNGAVHWGLQFLKLKPEGKTKYARAGMEPALTRSGMRGFDTDQHQATESDLGLHSVVKPRRKKLRFKSQKAMKEDRPPLISDEDEVLNQIPPLSLLQEAPNDLRPELSSHAMEQNAHLLESVLNDYGVRGKIQEVKPGPVVTLYELLLEPGVKVSRVMGLADDIARNMSALSARISKIPGRDVVGIELPNDIRETVYLRELLADKEFGDSRMDLAIAVGKDIGGDPTIVDLAKMPHLLIAGTTGSGKSVAINTMILSLLYRLPPEQCRLIMIDPKMLELSVYDGIPHLLTPVVTDPRKAVVALKWAVAEMEERNQLFSKIHARNIATFNERAGEAQRQGKKLIRRYPDGFDENGDQVICEEEIEPNPLPYIVVIIDEMADLMMVAGKETEACVQRLTQMARAAGIHVVMATQRPSVDVITGTIKANLLSRVSFQVTSKIDSRTILGEQGAEQLLGQGDMLYMSGGSRISRVHGPFVSDEEVEKIANFLRNTGEPEYLNDVLDESEDMASVDASLGLSKGSASADQEYNLAVQIVLRDRKCSTSYIQRRMEIGYNKAARLVERMESEGLISAANHVGKRDILIPE